MQVGIHDAFLISMITTVVNVVSTPVSFYTVEKFGRRSLLVYGAIAMCICEFIIAIVGVSASASPTANYVLIVFVCIYIFFFASTWVSLGRLAMPLFTLLTSYLRDLRLGWWSARSSHYPFDQKESPLAQLQTGSGTLSSAS